MRIINLTATGGWQRLGAYTTGSHIVIQCRTAADVSIRQYGSDNYFTIKSGSVLQIDDRNNSLLEVQSAVNNVIEIITGAAIS